MRYIFLFIFSLFTISLVLPQTVSAHILKTNGTIGAVMHVTPDDDPIANEQSDFFFEFKDTTNTFSSENCDCQISILEQGKAIYTKPLFPDNTDASLNHASLSFTFPQKDVYQVQVTGQPIRQGKFSSFTLLYDIRVERNESKTANASPADTKNQNWLQTHVLHAIPGIIAVVFLIGILLQKRKKK